ncbi:MAG: tetratricopeptide repeat protein [Myxococcales bacterium]|nr:tetratricopeptide repeat protein [Myxococcales bacterium]MCB9576370.1 tetratricopeptide repeat protein [Polyangiaceae bacterium]
MRRTVLLIAALLVACAGTQPTPEQRAVMLVDKGQNGEAIRVLSDYLKQHPDALKERRLLIRIIALTGDLGRAAAEAEQLAKYLPSGDPSPWIEMGHAYELAHRYDEALSMYDRAAQVAPKDAAGPKEGGLRAARWGEVELAEPRLEEAARRAPSDAEVWHALGVVRLKLRDLPGAVVAYRSGLRADPRALENRIGLATVAVMRDDAPAALQQYDAIIAARPRVADAHLGRSWALLRMGRLDAAAEALRDAERLGASPRAVRAQKRLLARLRSASEEQRNR